MMTNIRFFLGSDGELDAEATPEKADVHFEEPEDTQYGPRVDVTGNTYPVKESIKGRDIYDTGSYFDGDVWQIRLSAVRKVTELLLDEMPEVTAEVETVESCDELSEWHDEVEVEGDDDSKLIFRGATSGPGGVCTREWAEDAARVGNFDDVDEFVDRFNLEIAPADEIEGIDSAEEHDDGGSVVSSG